MFRALSWVAVLSLASASPARAQSPPPQPARDRPAAPAATGTAAVRGRVVDAATGRGLSKVQVRANTNTSGPPPTPYPWMATTDANGRYEITGIPAGTYAIAATKPNYVRAAYGAERVEGPGKRMILTDGQVLDKIDLKLSRTGAITGNIVDEFGDPVTDVSVSAMRYQYVQGSRRLMPSGRGGSTNDIGEYRIYGLTPGQYYVSAVLRNFGGGMQSETTDRSTYAPTFYPGTGNVADAQRLTIAPGQTATAINLGLLPIQAAKISGRAMDAAGQPLSNVMINVMQRLGSAMVNNSAVPIGPDGKFTLSLTPGDYYLRVFGNATQGATTELTVTGADIDDLQLMVLKPSLIRGRIAFTDSAAGAAPPKPTAIDLGAWREWMIGQPVRSAAKIKDDGTFEISLQPGHVLLRGAVSGPPPSGPAAAPWRLNRVLQNDLDISDIGLDVPANATIENIVFEMTDHSSPVSGRITDAEGKTVRDCFVIVFAQDPTHWTVQTRHLSVSRPGLDDLFHTRLLAGDYYAVAMSDVEPNAWTDPEFLSLAREHATKFSIADGESRTIDLVVTAAPVF